MLRALCPFHGSDRQRSLRVQVHSGRFVCFACGAWGYMETARAQWREEQQRQAAFGGLRPTGSASHTVASHHRRVPRPPAAAARPRSAASPAPRAPPRRPDLAQQLARVPGGLTRQPWRGVPAAAGHSPGPGAAARRGLCGAGHLAHAARDWRGGRVVFPHTTPDGHMVNLYGRAVGTCRAGPQSQASRSSPRCERLLQRGGAAGRRRTAVGL